MDRTTAGEIAADRTARYERQAEDEYLYRVNDYTDDLG